MSVWHPDDMTLMNYSAGNLSTAEALAVATHLFFCHQCRTHAKNLNHLGGALLETIKPASAEAGGFEKLMASLDEQPRRAATKSAYAKTHEESAQTFYNPLEKYLPAKLTDIHWKKQTGDISKFDLTHLLNAKGFQVALKKIRAGARVPTHTHKGREYTVILSGGFSDELGVYHQGDFIARDASHHHSPTALQNEDCICLTVLSAPLKFTGWYRILNPFMAWS